MKTQFLVFFGSAPDRIPENLNDAIKVAACCPKHAMLDVLLRMPALAMFPFAFAGTGEKLDCGPVKITHWHCRLTCELIEELAETEADVAGDMANYSHN